MEKKSSNKNNNTRAKSQTKKKTTTTKKTTSSTNKKTSTVKKSTSVPKKIDEVIASIEVKEEKKKDEIKNCVKFKNYYITYRFIVVISLFILLIIFGFLFLFKGNKASIENNNEEIEETPKEDVIEETELSLIMVGDCLIHGSIYMDAQENGTYNFYKMLDRIKPIVSSYDLAYYNQESILGGTSLGLQTYPRFNSPQEVGDAMLDAGFNIVTFANNHSLDMGEKGILSALSYWETKKDQGIMMAGSYSSFEDRDKDVIMEKNGITYTILSYTTTLNGLSRPSGKEYLVNYYNAEQVKADVERLRDKVDLLMVAMHWGEEYTHNPTDNQKEIAQYLADLGVDIIIGHHPHVIQPIDFIGDTMVIYSLGNFIASQKGEIAKHTGLMASVKVHKTTINGESKITLLEPTADLEYVYSVPVSSNSRKNYKLYPYSELNDSLLKGYKDYYYKFMDIVTKYNKNILYKTL